MKIHETEGQSRISGGGIVFTQTPVQCRVYGRHVFSSVISLILYPLWFLMGVVFISGLIMFVSGQEKEFKETLIMVTVTGPIFLMLHCLLLAKPFFTLNADGLRFYWRIFFCRLPWRFIPLEGIVGLVMEDRRPYTPSARLVIYTDRQTFYFATTRQIDIIEQIVPKLQQRLFELLEDAEITPEPLVMQAGFRPQVGILFDKYGKKIDQMPESFWEFDPEEACFYHKKNREFFSTFVQWRTMPFWFLLSALNIGLIIELILGTCVKFFACFSAADRWQLKADRICHIHGRNIEEFPFKNITAAIIVLNVRDERIAKLSDWFSLWGNDWMILFYDSDRTLVFSVEDMKFGDACWMVEQIRECSVGEKK